MGASIGRGAARSGRRGRKAAAPMAEINVTPFVDVMLVLLIIFMVAAPLLTVGVPLQLPKTAATPLPTDQEEPLTLNIDNEGRVYLQKSEIPLAALVAKLRAVAAERQNDRVFLRADASVGYGLVMQVMGALNAGGFRDIGLVTDPVAPGGALNTVSSAVPGALSSDEAAPAGAAQ